MNNKQPKGKDNSTNINNNTLNTAQLQIKNTPDQSKSSTKKEIAKQPTLENRTSINNSEFLKISERVDVAGKIPSARFGHTMVLVSATKSVLFGGAVGDTRNFSITNDTFCFNILTKIWSKLECK